MEEMNPFVMAHVEELFYWCGRRGRRAVAAAATNPRFSTVFSALDIASVNKPRSRRDVRAERVD